MEDFVTVARITRTHGIRGEVVAVSLTDFPERFGELGKVRVETAGRISWETLESHRFHGQRILLKFAGLDSPQEVAHLIGGEVQVPESERVQPPPDVYFHSELLGCRVFNRDESLGVVRRVLDCGAASWLEIEDDQGEILVPLARQYLRRVTTGEQRIEVDLPADLIELNRTSISSKGRKQEQESTQKTERSQSG